VICRGTCTGAPQELVASEGRSKHRLLLGEVLWWVKSPNRAAAAHFQASKGHYKLRYLRSQESHIVSNV
jgi:hypothetical protein